MAEQAKAKLQAVLDNPGRNDASSYRQRVLTTKYPTGAGSDMINVVNRRESTSSHASADQERRKWGRIKNWMNRPAY
ncbi:hypothetical protein FZEAL_8306 [Fusarium zealandicum]|uniref:Uncharacterized protein n=1 Tax=Fusarium zealandicum TaxID=1053134 RepID=A0A8H4XGY1_9HYPO|nr:hypothetical protein FZEAL_8306 [Fusarium zealandicum]